MLRLPHLLLRQRHRLRTASCFSALDCRASFSSDSKPTPPKPSVFGVARDMLRSSVPVPPPPTSPAAAPAATAAAAAAAAATAAAAAAAAATTAESTAQPSTRASLRRFLSLLKPESRPLAFSVGTMCVTTAISLVFPAAIGHILDIALAPTASITPVSVAAGMFGLFVVQTGFMGIRTTLMANLGERIANKIRVDMYSHLLDQEIAFFDRNRTGDLLNRLSSDTVIVQKSLTNNISTGLRSIFMAVGGTWMMVILSPSLALVSLCVIPPVGVVGVLYGRYVKKRQKDVQAALGKSMEVLCFAHDDTAEEVVSNIRTVVSFAQQEKEKRKFADKMDAAYEQARQVGIATGWFEGLVHLAANMSLLTVLGYGGSLVVDGSLTAGQLTSFLVYSMYVGINVSQISGVYADVMKAVGASARIFEIFDRTPSMPVSGGVVLESCKGDVTFSNVSFAYPLRADAHVLSELSLSVPAGKTLAIVGGSGSGKSTLGALLCRLYDVNGGAICIDGVDIKTMDPQWLRRCVGVVSQEPVLFAGSIEDNIRYAKPDASDEEVQAAAVVANAHSFISSFPDGYKTLVGERGVQVSGGQRARLAIARLVLKNPPIVLLDEATAALDAESEYLVQDALNRTMAGRTVISIAHRLSTMKTADKIAVLQGGRIVETGDFNSLVHLHGSAFSELVKRQLQ